MKLMTKKIEKRLQNTGNKSIEHEDPMNREVIVKYFNPCGAGTWLITEGEKLENDDWQLFGYCHIHEWEWGYVMLSDLEALVIPPFGMKIERDLYCSGYSVRELAV